MIPHLCSKMWLGVIYVVHIRFGSYGASKISWPFFLIIYYHHLKMTFTCCKRLPARPCDNLYPITTHFGIFSLSTLFDKDREQDEKFTASSNVHQKLIRMLLHLKTIFEFLAHYKQPTSLFPIRDSLFKLMLVEKTDCL